MAKKGNGNITKWDDFPVEVEVVDEVVISDQRIHFELSSSSGHQNCCEVLYIGKQKIADVRVQLHELLRKKMVVENLSNLLNTQLRILPESI